MALLGLIETGQEKQEASAVGQCASMSFTHLKGALIVHGDTAWITPPGGSPIKLSRQGTSALMARIADRASERIQRKVPALTGETGRYFRSAFGVSCPGPGAPLTARVCPECSAERLLAPVGLELAELL